MKISKLLYDGEQLLPISVSEAIVVETSEIPSLKQMGTTTLNKVLGKLSSNLDDSKIDIEYTGLKYDLYDY